MTYAKSHPKEFPDGRTADARQGARLPARRPGPLLRGGQPRGLRRSSSTWSAGSRSNNPRAINDPRYGGWTDGRRIGFYLTAGKQQARRPGGARLRPLAQGRRRQRLHPGPPPAAAAPGAPEEDDRPGDAPEAARRSSHAAGDTLKTNFPPERLARHARDLRAGGSRRRTSSKVVLGPPVRHEPGTGGLYILVPDMKKFAKLSVRPLRRGQPLLRATGRRESVAVARPVAGGRSAALAALEHRRDRPQHDLEVEPERPAVDVVEVEPRPSDRSPPRAAPRPATGR